MRVETVTAPFAFAGLDIAPYALSPCAKPCLARPLVFRLSACFYRARSLFASRRPCERPLASCTSGRPAHTLRQSCSGKCLEYAHSVFLEGTRGLFMGWPRVLEECPRLVGKQTQRRVCRVCLDCLWLDRSVPLCDTLLINHKSKARKPKLCVWCIFAGWLQSMHGAFQNQHFLQG